VGGLAAAAAVYMLVPDASGGLSEAARSTAAIGALMAVFWMTEALPLPATSLLPIVLFPVAGVAPIREAAAPYAHEFIFLFMGGFMIALAMERWRLHRRLALLTILAVGTQPTRLVGGFMLASAGLSMWISNTATTAMMLPIALSVIGVVAARVRSADGDSGADRRVADRFAICLMLSVAYAASIGGIATIIGTPPNVFLAGYLKQTQGIEISFVRWMAVGLPISLVFLGLTWLLLTRVLHPVTGTLVTHGRALIREEVSRLGPPSRGERVVLAVFLATAAAWILRTPLVNAFGLGDVAARMGNLDAWIAMVSALLLFALPVEPRRNVFALDWETARRLPWGVLLLFGGGLSLASAVQSSGLAEWIGSLAQALGGMPSVGLVVTVTAGVIFLTEITSNTATATALLPVLGGAAAGLGTDPLLLVVPAALAASCAFMLPVATPPNAIVFGSGYIRIADMARAGFALNLLGILLITLAVYTTVAWALGVGAGG
jgi:sodium-dependent dicarboxylate transporter 2/3/5